MAAAVKQTEASFQAAVTELAHICGYAVCHVRRTIGKHRRWTTGTSIVGWPDLMIYGHGRFFMAEIKTLDGKVTETQSQVHADLRAAGIDVHVWTPADWDAIRDVLTAHTQVRHG
jgi:hypothetical protein